MPENLNQKPEPLPIEEEIDVTEIIERISELQKEIQTQIEALEKRLADCEESIDALCEE